MFSRRYSAFDHFVTEHDVLRLGPSLKKMAVMGSPPKVASLCREACLNHAKQCEAGFWPKRPDQDLPVETSPNTINCWKIRSSDTSHISGLET